VRRVRWVRVLPERSPLWLIWAAAWRAQAAHLLLFVLVPLALTIGRTLLAIVFLPFFLIGEGDTNVNLSRSMDHLRQPDCWIVLAECSAAGRVLFELPWVDNGGTEEPSGALSLADRYTPHWPDAVSWRHGWFVLWLVWFVVYLRRREKVPDHPGR
jgi:hypothetical protein